MLSHTWALRGQVCRARVTLHPRSTLPLRLSFHQTWRPEQRMPVSCATTSNLPHIKTKSELLPLIIMHYTLRFAEYYTTLYYSMMPHLKQHLYCDSFDTYIFITYIFMLRLLTCIYIIYNLHIYIICNLYIIQIHNNVYII